MLGRNILRLCLGVVTMAAVSGCEPEGAATVAEAHESLRTAVTEKDPVRFYYSLDRESQWSVITIQTYYREVRAAVLGHYPKETHPRELERTRGAELRRPAEFFAVQAKRRRWLEACTGCSEPASRIEERGLAATVYTTGGKELPFARMARTGWGYAGLRKELEDLKRQAFHDAQTAKENARLYEQARAKGGTP